MAPHVRKDRLQPADLVEQGRRRDASADEPEGRAAIGLMLLEARFQRALEGRPVADLAADPDRLRAIRIVKRKDLRLREDVRRAEARGMAGIAFDLDRPALERRDERAPAITGERERRRVMLGEPGDEAFRQMHVRQLFERLLGDDRLVGHRARPRERGGPGRQHLKRGSPRQGLTHERIVGAHR